MATTPLKRRPRNQIDERPRSRNGSRSWAGISLIAESTLVLSRQHCSGMRQLAISGCRADYVCNSSSFRVAHQQEPMSTKCPVGAVLSDVQQGAPDCSCGRNRVRQQCRRLLSNRSRSLQICPREVDSDCFGASLLRIVGRPFARFQSLCPGGIHGVLKIVQ
jgi:hypothetical protein